jgi:TetR/AcrR family transcriptional repressor of nem operon
MPSAYAWRRETQRLDFDRPVNYIIAMDARTDTRQRLIDSARDLIYTRSYSDVGVQEICDRAGVRKGSFYHFFPSKRDLTLAVLDQLQAFFRQDIIGRAFAADIPPLQRISRFFDYTADFQQQMKQETGQMPGCPFGNLACEMSTRDEIIRQRVEQILRDGEVPFEQALSEAISNGELPELDTAAKARALFAYAEGIMVYAKASNNPEMIRELGKHALQLVVPQRPA